MRPIDAEPVEEWLDVAKEAAEKQRIALAYAMKLVRDAPTLAAHGSQEDNAPLEVDQLLQMNGQPVYIVAKPDPDGEQLKFWALVEVGRFYSDDIFLTNAAGGRSEIEEVINDIEAIYRRPPEVATA